MYRLRLFGPPDLLSEDRALRVHKKHLALLGLLAIEPSRTHDRGFLARTLWPGSPPENAANSLRQSLISLKKLLPLPGGPALVISRPPRSRTNIGLHPDFPLHIDIGDLLIPPRSCTIFHDPEDCPSCEKQLSRSLREIAGPFMDGFSLSDCDAFEGWLTARREELAIRVRWTTNRLVGLYEKRRLPHEALAILDGALRLDPLDETCQRRKILLLSETGNTMAALSQYELFRRRLNDQLGLLPSPETRTILEAIRQDSPGKPEQLSERRDPLFPGLSLSPEWRPATALHVELAELRGGDEDLPIEPSPEIDPLLSQAQRYLQEMGAIISRRDTRSLLVWFGVAGEAEGAARKAARAALGLRHMIEKGSGKKSRRLTLVAGIHSGRILQGDHAATPDPTGTVSRWAQALSMQAELGEILLSLPTSRLLKGQFALGRPAEVRILGQRARALPLIKDDPSGGGADASLRLISRTREIATFESLWQEDKGGVLVVEGEAGIGKTALVRAIAALPGPREALLRKIECFPQLKDSPFAPAVRLLRGPAGIPDGMEEGAAYTRLLAYARELSLPDEQVAVALLGRFFSLPPHPEFPLPALPAASLREETIKTLLAILKNRSRTRRILFVIEDVHWTDDSTGDLLRRILSDPLFTRRVLFIVTTRTGEDPPWLSGLPEKITLHLSPLDPKESRTLVRSISATSPLPEEEISRILDAADGVPLFLEELTRERIESSDSPRRSLLPSTLSEVLSSRLDRLGEARVLLQRASVYGRIAPMELLRALSPESPEHFEELLRQAIATGLVSRELDPSGEIFSFRHALIATAALESLPAEKQRVLHRQIADILPVRFPERAQASPGIVARHFEESGDFPQALIWLERSVSAALAGGFLPEAARLSRKALEILPLCPDSHERRAREIRLLVHLGTLLIDMQGRGSSEGEKAIQKACDLIRPGDTMREETFFAFYNLWDSRYGKADIRSSRERADSLVSLVNRSYHRDFRISALYADGSTAFWEGRFAHALQSLDTAVDLSDAAGVGPEASLSVREAQDYRLWTLWFLGRYRSTIRLAERLLDRDRTAAVNRKKGHLLTFSMVLYRYLGLPERVLAIADDLAQAIRTMKVPGWSGSERGFRGWAQVMTGDTKGLSLVLEGLALARKYHRIAENKYLPLLAECWLHLKEPRKAAGVALSGLRFSEKSGAAYCDAELWRLLGEARRQERKRKEAEACFLRALEISRQQGARALELRATISLGELLLSHSELKRAHEMLLPGISRLQNVMDETDPNLPDMNQAREILNILTL